MPHTPLYTQPPIYFAEVMAEFCDLEVAGVRDVHIVDMPENVVRSDP